MRAAFIDHFYHKKTLSSKFFIDIITPYCDVDIYWDESYINGDEPFWDEIKTKGYDVIILWQSSFYIRKCEDFKNTRFISIPMFDACVDAPDDWFLNKNVKYVCFSKELFNRLSKLNCDCIYIQYYPNPYDYPLAKDNANNCFFWERRSEMSFKTVEKLLDIKLLNAFNLHHSPDPNFQISYDENKIADKYSNITFTSWFNDKNDLVEFLSNYNIYIAPRIHEGIGFSFLEAMAMGQCVIASNTSTMNEYIIDEQNGYLFDADNPKKIKLEHISKIQKNARKSVEEGYISWIESVPELINYILEVDPKIFPVSVEYNNQIWPDAYISLRKNESKPLLSIVTPIFNATEHDISKTFDSILRQNFNDFEFIVVDGGSNDKTLNLLSKFKEEIDVLISEQDNGPYDAMNKGVKVANGEWVIFMNAGDYFISDNILTRVFSQIDKNNSPDFIYGDHIWLDKGIHHLHKSLPLSALMGIVQKNFEKTSIWRVAIPGHQATFTKRELLYKRPYDITNYKIAADHDFLFESIANGCSFLYLSFPISVYVSGGMSFQNMEICNKEQNAIYSKYKELLAHGKYYPKQLITDFGKFLKSLENKLRGEMIFIVTPCYNSEDTILKTIQSIIAQEGKFSIRYHLQDGCSNDRTISLIKSYLSNLKQNVGFNLNCKYILLSYCSQPDKGMYDAVNKGFEQLGYISNEAYMTYLNADDVLVDRALSVIEKMNEINTISWVSHPPFLYDEISNILRKWKIVFPTEIINAGLCDTRNWPSIQQEGTFWKKHLWDKVGGLNSSFQYAGDWDLWRKFSRYENLFLFEYPLALFRKHENQLSAEKNGSNYYLEICNALPEQERKEKIKYLLSKLTTLNSYSIKSTERHYMSSVEKLTLENTPDKYSKYLQTVKPNEYSSLTISNLTENYKINLNKIIKSSIILSSKQREIVKTVRRSGIFFYKHYLSQLNSRIEIDPLLYYLFYDRENLNPSVLFNSSWYIARYPEVAEAGHNALYHYIMWGAGLGYDPHPDFSTNAYLAANKDVKNTGMNPLAHYIFIGAIENRPLW
jgi:glycosyltransferase involved in cell wall biosynthesis